MGAYEEFGNEILTMSAEKGGKQHSVESVSNPDSLGRKCQPVGNGNGNGALGGKEGEGEWEQQHAELHPRCGGGPTRRTLGRM